MAIKKQVKEYSNRQRININKSDGFNTNDTVYLMTSSEYNQLNDTILELNKKLDNAELSKNTIIETNQNMLSDIASSYEKQIEKQDSKINQLQDELNRLKSIVSNFLIRFNGLNAWDVIFRKKHKELIDDVQQSVWISTDNVQIISKENTEAITEDDSK